MPEYLKAIVPFVGGLVLLVVGALLDEDALLYVGGTLVGVSPVVAAVPNKPKPKPRRKRQAGYGVIELLVAVILVILLIWLVAAVVDFR